LKETTYEVCKLFLLALLFLGTAIPAGVVFSRVNDRSKTTETPYAVEYNISTTPLATRSIIDSKFEVSNPIIKEIIELELPD
jgi:hypothetical protein